MQTRTDREEKERSEKDEMKRGEREMCCIHDNHAHVMCVRLCLYESCWTVDWIGCNAFTQASCRFDDGM